MDKRKVIWYLLFSLGLLLFLTGLIKGLSSWKEYRKAEDFYENTQSSYVTITKSAEDGTADALADSTGTTGLETVSDRQEDENADNSGGNTSNLFTEDTAGKDASAPEQFSVNDSYAAWYQWVQVDFERLQSINPDIIGWIWFENESISYPVLQGRDNQQYLRKTYEGTAATAGSIFAERLNSPDFSDSHTLIYGHNMHDGSMFGKLKNYRKEGYYAEHATFQIITPQGHYRYRIFAYEDVEENSFIYQVPFGDNEDFAAFLDSLQEISMIQTDISVRSSDKIITLSTCSSTGRRFVVHAKLEDSYPAP